VRVLGNLEFATGGFSALRPLFFSFIGSASWVSNIESEPNENAALPIWNGRKLRPRRLVEKQLAK
jgi:hypothetical protein